MALERTDPILERWLRPIVRRLDVDPNGITWLALGITIVAGILIATAEQDTTGGYQLLLAGLAVITVYVLDVLDGAIARYHNRCTPWGDYLDHTLDRVEDAIVLIAIGANSAWIPSPDLAWWALTTTLLASYLGTQAKAANLGRDLSGFGRNDRLALLTLGLFVTAGQAFVGAHPVAPAVDARPFASAVNWVSGESFNGLIFVLAGITLGSIYTVLKRFLGARASITKTRGEQSD